MVCSLSLSGSRVTEKDRMEKIREEAKVND